MDKSFSRVNDAFGTLKARFQAGEIARQEFIDEMKKLRIRDEEGRFWMIGAQTGKWYFFDGKEWIQSEPPSQAARAAICIYCGFENRIDAGNVYSYAKRSKDELPWVSIALLCPLHGMDDFFFAEDFKRHLRLKSCTDHEAALAWLVNSSGTRGSDGEQR